MKFLPFKTLVIGLAACLSGVVSAQTTFNGGDLGNAGNWTNGLPTSALNPGSIAVNGTMLGNPATIYTDYYITQTAGVISFSGSGNDPTLSGGTYEQNGGTWGVASGGRGFRTSNGNVTTLTSGKIISGSNGNTSIGVNGSAGATLHVNGGSLETYGIARSILVAAGSTLNINGGTVFTETTGSATNIFGKNHLGTGNNVINLNGGSTTVNFVAFGNNNSTSQLTITMGGSTVGSFTAVNFKPTDSQELASERRFNWLPGTKMTFRISSVDEWAQAEWDLGRLFYNGQSKADLADLTWADATNSSIGVGGGNYFVYDSGTETLSLGSGAPPASNPFQITAFSAVTGEPGVWQVSLTGDASTGYVFRSSTILDFSSSSVVENLTLGVPVAGTIGGTNNSVVTTNGSGVATVRMTLSGNPSDFVRAETAP